MTFMGVSIFRICAVALGAFGLVTVPVSIVMLERSPRALIWLQTGIGALAVFYLSEIGSLLQVVRDEQLERRREKQQAA